MRELTKSMIRFSWTMSLFAAEQLANMISYREGVIGAKAVDAFDKVSAATEGQLGGLVRGIYRTGDRVQSAAVDLTFDALTLGRGKGSSSSSGTSAGSGGADSVGWGPVPPAPQVA